MHIYVCIYNVEREREREKERKKERDWYITFASLTILESSADMGIPVLASLKKIQVLR